MAVILPWHLREKQSLPLNNSLLVLIRISLSTIITVFKVFPLNVPQEILGLPPKKKAVETYNTEAQTEKKGKRKTHPDQLDDDFCISVYLESDGLQS